MVLRHAPLNGKERPLDNKWTYGKINRQKGYLTISDVPIHRIVVYAFLGNPPTDKHVVDMKNKKDRFIKIENYI